MSSSMPRCRSVCTQMGAYPAPPPLPPLSPPATDGLDAEAPVAAAPAREGRGPVFSTQGRGSTPVKSCRNSVNSLEAPEHDSPPPLSSVIV